MGFSFFMIVFAPSSTWGQILPSGFCSDRSVWRDDTSERQRSHMRTQWINAAAAAGVARCYSRDFGGWLLKRCQISCMRSLS